jgi:hypothetical protein
LGLARDETYESQKTETNKCEKEGGKGRAIKKPNRKRGKGK